MTQPEFRIYQVSNHTSLNVEFILDARNITVSTHTHFELVREMLQLCDRALLVSPFLYNDFDKLFNGLVLKEREID